MRGTRPLFLALFVLLLVGCDAFLPLSADTEPWSTTPRGRVAHERAMTRGRARDVLGQLAPEDRATLDELMFIADLQQAAGNENNPLRLYRRVQRELAEPRVVSRPMVATVLEDMARVMEAHPGVPEGPYDQSGYEVVTAMLASAQGAFPSGGSCLERIASMPDEVAVAFLVVELYADDHYSPYGMKALIFDLLLTGDFGPLPLLVIEDQLRGTWPYREPTSDWSRSVAAGRAITGEDFAAWYREVRGHAYAWEWLTAGF